MTTMKMLVDKYPGGYEEWELQNPDLLANVNQPEPEPNSDLLASVEQLGPLPNSNALAGAEQPEPSQ